MSIRRQKRYAVFLLVNGTDVEWYNNKDKSICEDWVQNTKNQFPSIQLDFRISTSPILTFPFENGQFDWIRKTLGVDYENPREQGNIARPIIELAYSKYKMESNGWKLEYKPVESRGYNRKEWIEEFKATHPIHGIVFGDFAKKIYASSQKCFEYFSEYAGLGCFSAYELQS
jgi:hypothetical protein